MKPLLLQQTYRHWDCRGSSEPPGDGNNAKQWPRGAVPAHTATGCSAELLSWCQPFPEVTCAVSKILHGESLEGRATPLWAAGQQPGGALTGRQNIRQRTSGRSTGWIINKWGQRQNIATNKPRGLEEADSRPAK